MDLRGLLSAVRPFYSSLEPFAEPKFVLIFAENLLARFYIMRYYVTEVGGGIIVKFAALISLFIP